MLFGTMVLYLYLLSVSADNHDCAGKHMRHETPRHHAKRCFATHLLCLCKFLISQWGLTALR